MTSTHQDENLGTFLTVTRLCHVEDYQSLHCSVNISWIKNQDLEMFWSLGITDPIDREGDDEALKKFYKLIVDGRYQVTSPWKRDKSELPDNSKVAKDEVASSSARGWCYITTILW